MIIISVLYGDVFFYTVWNHAQQENPDMTVFTR